MVVGRVGDISFDDKTYQALVTLELEAGYKFPKDSSLKILTAGLLGEQYIGIEPGGDTEQPRQWRPHRPHPIGDRAGRPDQSVHLQQGR